MFSVLIKEFRDNHALSQEDLAQMLMSFSGRESIDVTTISRWERGVSTPSIQNQLYILRKLDIKFPLLSIIQHQSSHKIVNLLKSRFSRFSVFSDKPYRMELPKFTYTETNQLVDFLNDEELIQFNKKMFSLEFDTDFLNVYGSELSFDEMRFFRFYRGNLLVGHSVYAIVNTRDIIELLNGVYKFDFYDAFHTELDGKVLISLSGYASDFAIYLFSARLCIQSLQRNSKVDWLVGHSFINEDWQIQKKLGAKNIYLGENLEEGGVKVGKSRFKFLIFNHFVPTLLSSPLGVLSEHHLDRKYAEVIESLNN